MKLGAGGEDGSFCAGLQVDEDMPVLCLSLHSVIRTNKMSPTAKNKAGRHK